MPGLPSLAHQPEVRAAFTHDAGPPNRFNGTLTGFPNSSATSWSFGTHAYRIILHCTATCDRGYDVTESHPCSPPQAAERRHGRDRGCDGRLSSGARAS